jgi:RIO kinase 2
MVKLDPSILRYLNREHMRVLTCVEMGMKNHDLVPTQLINTIAQLKHGGAHKALSVLHKYKLVYHERKQCTNSRFFFQLQILLSVISACGDFNFANSVSNSL